MVICSLAVLKSVSEQMNSCLVYFEVMEVRLMNYWACCTFRCLIEAWSLLRQHSNHLNMSELLGFLYESCQELSLIKELLKLPLGLGQQVGHRRVN